MIDQAVILAASYLNSQQQSDGSFLSLSSVHSQDFSQALKFHSVFSTTLILQNLTTVSELSSVATMKKVIVAFLLAQKSAYWSWNYWVRQSREAKKLPYPDDLDDTFCALSGLFLADETVITGEVLGYMSQLLTALEVKEGGPYKTWLAAATAESAWQDVDLVVNSNIAYFLALQGITLPKLTKLFHEAIRQKKLDSPYYPVKLPIIYFLSRVVKNVACQRILKNLVEVELKKDAGPLSVALALEIFLQTKYPVKKLAPLVEKLLTTQAKNGSWPAATFYTGVNPARKKKFYAGSAALTTSFCLAALRRYDVVTKKVDSKILTQPAQLAIRDLIIQKVVTRFAQSGATLQPLGQGALQKIVMRDADSQITLLPYFLRSALGKNGAIISDDLVVDLGAASIYGWIAYTVYDDFLDDEGKPLTLPLANLCLRELTQIFTTAVTPATGFVTFFHQVMDRLDATNTWEVAQCRFQGDPLIKDIPLPNYGQYEPLAERSLGHALGSVALLMSLGYTATSPMVKHLMKFYQHFLIARQLNDDAHDWEKDLKAGQINSVGAQILTVAQSRYSTSKIAQVSQQLQELFWLETIDVVCNQIEKHVQLAKTELQKITVITQPDFLIKLVDKQMQSVSLVRKEKKQALEFLQTYGSS